MWSILSASLIVTVVYKGFKNKYLRVLGIVFGVFFVALFPNWQNNVWMYPYFVIGFVFGEYRDNGVVKKLEKLRWLSLPLFISYVCFFTKKEHLFYVSGMKTSVSIDMLRWGVV